MLKDVFTRLSGGTLLSLTILSMVSNLLMLTGPLFMMQVYDRVLASRSLPTLTALVLLISALFAFYGFIEAIRSRIATRYANVFDHSVSDRLFVASVKLRLAVGTATPLDPLRDSDTLRSFLGSGAPLAFLDLPWVPLYLALVFILHPMLGWLAMGGGALIVTLMFVNELLHRNSQADATVAAAARQQCSDDARNNAESLVAMGMLGDVSRRWRRQTTTMLGLQRIGADRLITISSITKAVRFLLQSLVLAAGAYLVIQGEMTGGLMIGASVITSRALAPVEQVIGHWRHFIQARQALGRITLLLKSVEAEPDKTKLPLPNKSLAIRQLSAAPKGGGRPIISGITLELAAGDALGVLGGSGSGKTSLARAVLGIWNTPTGELRFDGAPLDHYLNSQIKQLFGYLPQRVELLDGTIAENISRFSSDARSEDVIAAARLANSHELINNLEDGYSTQVGPQGDRLSAGQRQRIGLARALYGDPFVVVLDEPNSNLDAEGDSALTAAIRRVRARGGIAIVIAHRPSAIVAVNKLLFIKDGRQVAFGPKDEVLQQIKGDTVRALKMPAQ